MKWKEFSKKLFKNDFRLSPLDVQNLTGIKQPTINRWYTGEIGLPQRGTLKKIEKALNIKIDDSDPDNITYTRLPELPKDLKFDDAIPAYRYPVLATVYAGEPDLLNHENVDEYQYFTYRKNGNRCFAVKVNGKSMETTLHNGDIVLVDMDTEISDGDLVAVKLKNGNQYIKRYYDENAAFIRLASDNKDYGVRLIDKNDIVSIFRVVQIVLKL